MLRTPAWFGSSRPRPQDGRPSRVSDALRRRIGGELVILVILSMVYLWLMPGRGSGVDAGFALLGLGAVGLTAKETRERVWGPAVAPALERLRRCAREMVFFTVPVVLLFGGYGAVSAYVAEGQWGD